MNALELRLGAAAYPLTLREAETARDRLHRSYSVAAQTLAATITAAITADNRRSPSVMLGLDDIAELRSVLCGTDVGACNGLRALQAALCTVDGAAVDRAEAETAAGRPGAAQGGRR